MTVLVLSNHLAGRLTLQFHDCRVPEEGPPEIAQLLTACFSPRPADRPSILQVYKTLREA